MPSKLQKLHRYTSYTHIHIKNYTLSKHTLTHVQMLSEKKVSPYGLYVCVTGVTAQLLTQGE